MILLWFNAVYYNSYILQFRPLLKMEPGSLQTLVPHYQTACLYILKALILTWQLSETHISYESISLISGYFFHTKQNG